MTHDVNDEIVKLEEDMASAIVNNDAQTIGECLADDWVIIAPEGAVITKSDFLTAVESGALTHELMEFTDWRVRVYANAVIATCRARSAGNYNGEAFSTHERSTSVYVKENTHWQCVFTQLTPLSEK